MTSKKRPRTNRQIVVESYHKRERLCEMAAMIAAGALTDVVDDEVAGTSVRLAREIYERVYEGGKQRGPR
jgi:hypothetical protein